MERMPQRESGISRVIGVDAATEGEILSYFRELFESGEESRLGKEHNPEVDKIISEINDQIRDFLARYGVESLDTPPGNVVLLDRAKVPGEQRELLEKKYATSKGAYSPIQQRITMLVDYGEGNKLEFCQTLAHEMLHLNSFTSLQKRNEADERAEAAPLEERRVGFEVNSPKNGVTYFRDLNEAIMTELTIAFDRQYFSKIPELASEYNRRQKVIEGQSNQPGKSIEDTLGTRVAYLKLQKEDKGGWDYDMYSYSYEGERKNLNTLINELYQKNKSRFNSREQVFDLFANATLTGRLLPVARLIEETLGKGSFRMIGKRSGERVGSS